MRQALILFDYLLAKLDNANNLILSITGDCDRQCFTFYDQEVIVLRRTDPITFVQTVKHKMLLLKTEFYFQRGYKHWLIVDFCYVLYSWWKWIGHFENCGEIYWLERWACQPTQVFLPGESHGQRSLAGCSPWGHKELDRTEWLSTYWLEVNILLF